MALIESLAGQAALERLWSYTVGIINGALRTQVADRKTGVTVTQEGEPGTGCAGSWGKHHFVLTAKHVLERANPRDLSFFVRSTGTLKAQRSSTVNVRDAVSAVPVDSRSLSIHRCRWEDLAILTIPKEALGLRLEFFDLKGLCVDPAGGDTLHGVGYPVSSAVIREAKAIGPAVERMVILSPTPFTGNVLPLPKFKLNDFATKRHCLIPYEPAKEGKSPNGISGAAVWEQADEKQGLWTARFAFAGICVASYKRGTIVKVVKASLVRRFLAQALGPRGN